MLARQALVRFCSARGVLASASTSASASASVSISAATAMAAAPRRVLASTAVVPRAPRVAARIATRSYAVAANPAAQDTRPPVEVYGLDGTYASALFTAAAKSSSLDQTAKALTSLAAAIEKDAGLAAAAAAPALTNAERNEVVSSLQKLAGSAGGDTIRNFLAALGENNRLGLLRSVCDKFGVLMSARRGEIEMVVTSATPLDSRTLTRLETAVSKSPIVGPGKHLKVTNTVNSGIVGGLVVEIGDRTIDLSVSSRIVKMNKLLTDAL